MTAEQAAALQGTAIANEKGEPIAVYHVTDNTEFTTFSEGDVDFHFGNLNQTQAHRKKRGYTSGRTFRAYLKIQNPIHVQRDIMGWHAPGTAFCLWDAGVLTDAEYQEIMSLWTEGHKDGDPASTRLREIIESKGYDGIVYPNSFEGKGNSYIAFHDEQIIRSEITRFGQNLTTQPPSGPTDAGLADTQSTEGVAKAPSEPSSYPAKSAPDRPRTGAYSAWSFPWEYWPPAAGR